MKKLVTILFVTAISVYSHAQTSELKDVERACLNYIEGFYEGDTTKLKAGISPDLLKFGYWKNKETGAYESEGQMTFGEAINYANNVKTKGSFAKPDAPKKVEVLDVGNHIASAKITAWWGIDYVLLAKNNGSWIIEQVLWEGPLDKQP